MTEEVKEQPVPQVESRRPDGTFAPGFSGNPKGKAKGKSLKEYQAQKFREMNDEEREIFLRDIGKDIRWRMAEGNPHQSIDSQVEFNPNPLLESLRGKEDDALSHNGSDKENLLPGEKS